VTPVGVRLWIVISGSSAVVLGGGEQGERPALAVGGRTAVSGGSSYSSIVIHSADRGVTQVGELDLSKFCFLAFLPTLTRVQAEAVGAAPMISEPAARLVDLEVDGERVAVDTMSADLSRIIPVQFPGGADRARARLRSTLRCGGCRDIGSCRCSRCGL
jgi:hypothetical protein